MPSRSFTAVGFTKELEAGFAAIRVELDVRTDFSPDLHEIAEQAAAAGPQIPAGASSVVDDKTSLPLVTIDPPGSIDLDQAFAAERRSDGYRVWYAIADVAALVAAGGPLDTEARRRGVTLYSPDQRASLHPEAINEGAGSLLPGQTRQAVLWCIDLDHHGTQTAAHATRALVTSREKLSYQVAQDRIDNGTANESLQLLKTIGLLRQTIESERGAVSLQLPAQEISLVDGAYQLHYDTSLPIEGWNAQISLLTGMAAGQIMVDAGHGLLRTLPPLDQHTVDQVRRAARALDVDWPAGMSYSDRVRQLDPANANEAALLTRAARSFRGAGYAAFRDGALPEQPLHGAINALYAHVTAPLRRVCDRFANEIVLAACADRDAPTWALEALDELPRLMGEARRRDGSLDRASTDFVEVMVLRSRIGEIFDGVVLSHSRRGANVQLREPAVMSPISGQPEVGSDVRLRLTGVDLNARRSHFEVISD